MRNYTFKMKKGGNNIWFTKRTHNYIGILFLCFKNVCDSFTHSYDNDTVIIRNKKGTANAVPFSLSKKSFLEFQTKSFLVQQFFKNAGGIQRQSLWSLTAVSENPLSKAHLRGVN